MYNEIKRILEERINEEPRFTIERISLRDEESERDKSLFSTYVTSELDRYVSEMYDERDAQEAETEPSTIVSEFGGLWTQRRLEKHLLERISMDMTRKMKTFNFNVPTGSRVFGPPYDKEWMEGNGFAYGGRYTGNAITVSKPNGFSAAGIGFYLTTNAPVLAAITPQGQYDWSWMAFENLPLVRSQGGMAITVYTDSQPQPTLSRQPVLWSLSGIWANNQYGLSGGNGNGRIANAASPAFGLGTVPLAPALINMVPGSRYLVWVWCWQASRIKDNDIFIAFLKFSMPFVTINAGPPILIR